MTLHRVAGVLVVVSVITALLGLLITIASLAGYLITKDPSWALHAIAGLTIWLASLAGICLFPLAADRYVERTRS